MSNDKKGVALNVKPMQRWLTIEISKGISKTDAIRILEKTIIVIGKNTIHWDNEFNKFVVLLEKETDSDDGIHVAKQITWRDIRRGEKEILKTCKTKAMRDYVKSIFPVFPEDESATQEEFIRLNQRKKIKPE